MATETYLRDIERAITKLVSEVHQTNKNLNKINETLTLNKFDELDPPPIGMMVMNTKGCVCMSRDDFDALNRFKAIAEEMREDRKDD